MAHLPLVLSLLVALGGAPESDAPRGGNPHLAQAIRELRELEEQKALRTLEQARKWASRSPEALAEVHLYLGLAYAGLARERDAVEHFHAGLLLDPGLVLPDWASPRVREWWVKAGGPSSAPPSEALAAPAPTPAPGLPPVATPDAARGPRWSQWSGRALMVLGAVAAGGAVWAGLRANALDAESRSERWAPAAAELRQRAESRARTANLLWGASAGAGAAGLVLVFVVD